MPLRRAKSSFSTGLQMILQPGQDLLVAKDVWVQSTDFHAIGARVAGQVMRIAGNVQGEYDAIRISHLLDGEDSLTAAGRATIIVEQTGRVWSDEGAALRFSTARITINNSGFIAGRDGINFDPNRGDAEGRGQNLIVNKGTILARAGLGVWIDSVEAAVRLDNSGKIVAPEVTGGNAALYFLAPRFTIVNTGTIFGDIKIAKGGGVFTNIGRLIVPNEFSFIGAEGDVIFRNSGSVSAVDGGPVTLNMGFGADLYDGLKGLLNGTIFGQAGNDRFIPGRGAEAIDAAAGQGLSEIDTLDFSTSAAGVRVDIENPAFNRGVAAGDSYADMDVIIGSLRGADFFIGGQYAERLIGNGGADTLVGSFGQDTLHGGLGHDRLTGGDGNDAFYFLTPKERGDVIVDFSNTGQDDVLQFDAKGFGLAALPTGPLLADYFVIGATNRAGDRDDRFIFDTRTDALWFDRDGTGSRYRPVMLAVFLGDPVLGADDIYILGL